MAWVKTQLVIAAWLVLASQSLPVPEDQQIFQDEDGRMFQWVPSSTGGALQFTTPPLGGAGTFPFDLSSLGLGGFGQGGQPGINIDLPPGFVIVQSRNNPNSGENEANKVGSTIPNLPPGYIPGLVFIFRPIGVGAAYVPPPPSKPTAAVQSSLPVVIPTPVVAVTAPTSTAKASTTTVATPTRPSTVSVSNKVVNPAPPCAHETEKNEPIPYGYAYRVQDPLTGDWKTVSEKSDGSNVSGMYAYIDSNGSLRSVDYTVKGDSGFVANENLKLNAAPVPPVAPVKSKGLNPGASFGAKLKHGDSVAEYEVSN